MNPSPISFTRTELPNNKHYEDFLRDHSQNLYGPGRRRGAPKGRNAGLPGSSVGATKGRNGYQTPWFRRFYGDANGHALNGNVDRNRMLGGSGENGEGWAWDEQIAVSQEEQNRPWYDRLERYDRSKPDENVYGNVDEDSSNAYEEKMQEMERELKETDLRHELCEAYHTKRLTESNGRPIKTPLMGGKTPPAAALVALYRDTVASMDTERIDTNRNRRAADQRVIGNNELLSHTATRIVEDRSAAQNRKAITQN